jgi:hypothetical protein
MAYEYEFVFSYTIFIFFFLLMITLGAPSFLTADAQAKLNSITIPTQRPAFIDIPIIGPIYGFLKGTYDGLLTLYLLLTFSASIRWITFIIVAPYTVTLFYIIVRLLRGGG